MVTNVDNTLLFKCSKSSMKIGLEVFIETTISKWNEIIIVNLDDF